MQKQSERIASLDGLRAISIGLVLIGHLSGTPFFFLSHQTGDFFSLAELGVITFFVISGFLITTLLLRELTETGRIQLLKFYFRRTLRIFPPYYTLLIILFFLNQCGFVSLSKIDLFHAATYTTNYLTPQSWSVGHTWSLSVEEQFYLLWPATLCWLGRRKAWWVAAILLIVAPLFRTLSLLHLFHEPDSAAFEMVADSIVVGCLLALRREWLHERSWYQAMLASRFFFLLPLLILLVSSFHTTPRLYYPVGLTFINIGLAVCVDWCLKWSEGRVGKILNSRMMVFVGLLSYSIYLWQQLFLNRASASVTMRFPLNIFCIALAALTSYFIVEKPSRQLRQRLEKKLFQKSPKILLREIRGRLDSSDLR